MLVQDMEVRNLFYLQVAIEVYKVYDKALPCLTVGRVEILCNGASIKHMSASKPNNRRIDA